jgi:hypothetical protein
MVVLIHKMTNTDPNTVVYYAHKEISERSGVLYLHASPSKRWVELHQIPHPIVKISVRERVETDPPSSYWGWLKADEPDCYIFVWPSEIQLDMCFPYGPKIEEQLGRGRKVNLTLTEIPEN